MIKKKFSEKELATIAEKLIDEAYSILPTIDAGGCVTEKQIENVVVTNINALLDVPTLNEESQSFMIQLRDHIRRSSVAV